MVAFLLSCNRTTQNVKAQMQRKTIETKKPLMQTLTHFCCPLAEDYPFFIPEDHRPHDSSIEVMPHNLLAHADARIAAKTADFAPQVYFRGAHTIGIKSRKALHAVAEIKPVAYARKENSELGVACTRIGYSAIVFVSKWPLNNGHHVHSLA